MKSNFPWRWLVISTIAFYATLTPTESARILAVFPTASRSHHIWNRALVTALASRGHQVTELSPFNDPEPPSGVRHLFLEDSLKKGAENLHSLKASLLERSTFSIRQQVDAFAKCCFDLCKGFLNSKASLEALKGEYDLLIMETFALECFYGFVSHLGLPTVAVSAHGHTPWNSAQMGSPQAVTTAPTEWLPYVPPMNFWQRAHNVFIISYVMLRRTFEHLPRYEAIARELFGDKMPSFGDIEKNSFSIFLVNTGPELDHPRPLPPSVVEVGCLHCRPGEPLNQDIANFLDNASEGAMIFSLGSNVRSETIPEEKLRVLTRVFARLAPRRVLLKWETSMTPPNLTGNVKLIKWLPQQDVLAHRNVRVFATHGGRLSSQEAAYHGVPVLVVSVFGDQMLHGRRAEVKGRGRSLHYVDLTEERFFSALEDLFSNQTYHDAARRHSAMCRDQPQSPLDRAVFWTEYVINHKGAPHLRSASLDLSWYQLHLLDVTALFILVLVTIVTLVCKCCGYYCCRRAKRIPDF